MMGISLHWWLLMSCKQEQDFQPDMAPLRRLTMTQIQNSLPVIFNDVATLSTSMSIGEFEYEIPYAPSESLALIFDNQQAFNEITPMQIQYIHQLSLSIGDLVVNDSTTLDNCFEINDSNCVLEYLRTAHSIAWRRPITTDEQDYLRKLIEDSTRSLEQNTLLAVQFILESPFFLYIYEDGKPVNGSEERKLSSWEMATRLSLLFWNQIPNRDLHYVASLDGLNSTDQIAHIATQMLADPLSAQGLIHFHRHWLDFPKIGVQVPDFDYLAELLDMTEMSVDDLGYTLHNELEPALQVEVLLLILDEIYYKEGRFSNFFSRNDAWISKDSAKIYGIQVPNDTAPSVLLSLFPQTLQPPKMYPVTLPAKQRSGILTRLAFGFTHMTGLHASPTQRGHFVLERLLCSKIAPPPSNVAPIQSFSINETQSNRNRYEQIAENSFCASCHNQMDGVGFAFENYGVFGEYLHTENQQEINSKTTIPTTDIAGEYQNALDLSLAIAQSKDAQNCYVNHWYNYAFGRQSTEDDLATLEYLNEGFQKSNGNIRELLINLVASHTFRFIQRK